MNTLTSVQSIGPDQLAPQSIEEPHGQDQMLNGPTLVQVILTHKIKILTGVIGLIGFVALYPLVQSLNQNDLSIKRDRLRIATVQRGEFVSEVVSQGSVVAAVSPTLFASSRGIVTLNVDAGDGVSKGDILATIHNPDLDNEIAKEQATYENLSTSIQGQSIEHKKIVLLSQQKVDLARVALTAAERELKRADALSQNSLISGQDYERAQDVVARARIEHQHAQQTATLEKESLEFELLSAQQNLDRQALVLDNLRRLENELTLRSPVNGIVGTLSVQQKATASINSPIVTVVDLSAFEVEAKIPESYAGTLGIGMPAVVSIGNSDHRAKLVAVSPEITDNSVAARVRFEQPGPQNLRQNQRVTLRVMIESKQDVLVLERGNFLDSGGGRIAYVVNGQQATKTPIQIGSSSIRQIEILNGLKEGDQVVISDLNIFKNKQKILLTN